MSAQLLLVCLLVGVGTYLFRYLPTRFRTDAEPRGAFGGALGAFLASVGIAAVTALLASSVGGLLAPSAVASQVVGWPGPAAANAITALFGVAVTLITFLWRRDVALSTLLGAAAYGAAWWLIA